MRMFRPTGAERLVAITAEPVAGDAGRVSLRVQRFFKRGKLTGTEAYGPFAEDELDGRLRDLADDLAAEGFTRAGVRAMLDRLNSPSARRRALSALRLGWIGDRTAVDPLLDRAALEGTELSCVVEALGRLGDETAAPLARAEAARKLLSRRRAGAEAVRALGDAVGLAEVTQRAIERLPQSMRDAWSAVDATTLDEDAVVDLEAVFAHLDLKEQFLALDTLYEIGAPPAVALVRRVLGSHAEIHRPHRWRYTKSILRRATLREDGETFAVITRRVELLSRKPAATMAVVKSGLDGQSRQTRVFSKQTERHVRKAAWRYLERLGRYRPAKYTEVAAAVLAAYRPEDRELPKGNGDEWSRVFLYNRILRRFDGRLLFNPKTLRTSLFNPKSKLPVAPSVRTESFPAVWDSYPRPLLHLLAHARVVEVQQFALRAVTTRHPELPRAATAAELVGMLTAVYPDTVELALEELDRRFDPAKPDWALLDVMMADERPVIREHAVALLTRCADRWTADIERIVRFVGSSDALLRSTAASLVLAALPAADPWFRRELAERVLAILQAPESIEGANDGFARVARDGLSEELNAILGLDEILAMIDTGSIAAKVAGGALLGSRPEAVELLGTERILGMAMSDIAAVRQAAHALIGASVAKLRGDPSVLFALTDCEWKDTRDFVFELLRGPVDVAVLGLDGIVGLCDSNRDDVQSFGREMALKHFDSLETAELLHRLAEHPSPVIRRFAVDLAVAHLKDGFVALSRLEAFFRRALLDVRPERREKKLVVDFLRERGLRDERQAEVASRVLGEFVRTRAKVDFESALDALVRLKLRFPEVESVVGGVA
ncbi:MAG: hypothetical protein JWM10_3428 [Myxococcaceae bacterium]|nr:hypothetical protein [Myxococcaceae bacterium]